MKILFVCLGNICRSPLAEGIAKFYAAKFNIIFQTDSAGISGWHNGEPPCKGSIQVAKKHCIDITGFRSRKVSVYSDDMFDLLIGLDRGNVSALLEMGFDKSKVHKLGKFGLNNADIPDPYHYKDTDGFEYVYDMIDNGVKNLLNHYFKSNIN
ncbi:low molecular weight protein-tyrosine-phosphatase [Helicobacter sp. 13S00477-4]|uniref:low molecular weight protein-tyrosine-phosphatase n=1 Tax=Helicobacter sp. 13S00477-4 TaxID=1905759 RepID=UPI000BA75E95|nr:low molecular weight protein-tyrosine-phosphatase [Helicobacter sp. 13S00477-4]PAF50814.1 protein tyrosine phosphatase [Helicobacter sp. 13S00477-4]